MIADTLIHDLARVLSPDALVYGEAERLPYGRDFWGQRGIPGVVVRAASVADVAAVLRFAAVHGVAVVPRGAGTNIGAGFLPSPDSILLDLRRLDRIVHIDAGRRRAVVEPGVLNGALQARLTPLGLCFSPDPASAPFSTIGGNIAENAGGPHCLKYGVTVHHVVAIDLALADGEIVHLDAGDDGPDLLGLIVGSEGTLGIVVGATLSLRPMPAVTRSLMAAFDRVEDAAEGVSAVIASGVVPAALEFFDRVATQSFEAFAPSGYPTDAAAILLVDVDGDATSVKHDLAAVERLLTPRARLVRRADDDEARAALWRGRLQAGAAIAASGQAFIIGDTTVPRQHIPAMQRAIYDVADRYKLHISTTGHAGDGNVHPTIIFDRDDPRQAQAAAMASDALIRAALDLGGTITGEHGVGSEKAPHMAHRFSPAELAAQRAVKSTFDPLGRLNPGVLLPVPALDEPSVPLFAQAVRAALAARHGHRGIALTRSRPLTSGDDAVVLDRDNLTAEIGARTTLDDLTHVLRTAGYASSLDHLNDRDRFMGEIVALAEGADRVAVRSCLLGLQAVLPDGLPVHFGSAAIKDVAGYDLKRLYIDGRGAFGPLSALTIRVTALPTV